MTFNLKNAHGLLKSKILDLNNFILFLHTCMLLKMNIQIITEKWDYPSLEVLSTYCIHYLKDILMIILVIVISQHIVYYLPKRIIFVTTSLRNYSILDRVLITSTHLIPVTHRLSVFKMFEKKGNTLV